MLLVPVDNVFPFMVENRYLSVLESLVGKLDEQELTGLEPPRPPPGAIGLPS